MMTKTELKTNYSISVIIPAYKRADILPRTVESALAQTYKPLEIIIVDDESPDHTKEVAQKLITKYSDSTIRYIRHDTNKGEAGARNTGIQYAEGEYLAFLDSDDEWLPHKLEKQVQFLQETNSDGVLCDYYLVSHEDYDSAESVITQDNVIIAEDLLIKGCGYCVGTNMLISKKACLEEDLFDESFKLFVDIDWLYRLAQKNTISILHEPLSYYHKAPMRSGDFIEEHALVFQKKYHEHLQTWSWIRRLKVYSCLHWYIANAYKVNQDFLQAAQHFALGIVQSPIRHPGHYWTMLQCLGKGVFYSLKAPSKKQVKSSC